MGIKWKSKWETNHVVKFVKFSDYHYVTDSGHLTFTAIFKGGHLAGMKSAFMVHSLQHITSSLQTKSSQGEPDCRVFPSFPWILRTAHQLQLLMTCGMLFPFPVLSRKNSLIVIEHISSTNVKLHLFVKGLGMAQSITVKLSTSYFVAHVTWSIAII